MKLQQIIVQYIRNLQPAELSFSPSINVIFGENGSGKTSILEAIYHLSLGRSFRTHHSNQLIQNSSTHFTVFGRFENGTTIGVEKKRETPIRLKVNGEKVSAAISLAEMLPLQLLHAEGFQLLISGPKIRRQFLNWGMFHVEPTFYALWERFQSSLTQRNALLRQGGDPIHVRTWDETFLQCSENLDKLRQHYLFSFNPYFKQWASMLFEGRSFELIYQKGWPNNQELSVLLAKSFERDKKFGYTQWGPQRAEWEIRCEGEPVQRFFSRGQLKLLICGLRLAQGQHLFAVGLKRCIFLVDDLASELDLRHREMMMQALGRMQAQVFVTGIDKDSLESLIKEKGAKLFHVKQGKIEEVSA